MARRKKTPRKNSNKQIKFWASVLATAVLIVLQQQGKPLSKTGNVEDGEMFRDVSVASVYDGDTFKINLNCSLAIYCEKVPVRVRGVDCPEIKGKTEKEKRLAQKAKAFTKDFLERGSVTLTDCGRDKYFRLLCDVTNGEDKDLAEELIRHKLGYAYNGGKKSTRYQ